MNRSGPLSTTSPYHLFLFSLVSLVSMAGCGGDGAGPPTGGGTTAALCEPGQSLPPLVEDRAVYGQDVPGVLTLHLDVTDLEALARVNANIEGAEVAVRLHDDSFGKDGPGPNGIMKLRGRSTRLAIQKSYKIKLASRTDLWRGHRELNLNKHPWDLTRIRNKLAFDHFRSVSNFTGLRTQFVQVLLNGEDLGIFTMIEEVDARFLARHGLDTKGSLYKPVSFNFQEIPADVAMNPAALERIVENKANPDHAKLAQMTRDVNDFNEDINDVIARHFNRNNYMTWLAVNLLTGNLDTGSSNYYLYSPSGCQGWYILPWDYDGAWGFPEQPGQPPKRRWRTGLANWWLSALHRRFFQDARNRADLDRRIEELRATVFSGPLTRELLDGYHDIVRPLIAVPPDVDYLASHQSTSAAQSLAQWRIEYDRVGSAVQGNYDEYQRTLDWPTPIWLSSIPPGQPLRFIWSPSYDFQGDGLTYDFELAANAAFDPSQLLVERRGLVATETSVEGLATGTYFWRAIARDTRAPETNWQVPFVLYEMIQIVP